MEIDIGIPGRYGYGNEPAANKSCGLREYQEISLRELDVGETALVSESLHLLLPEEFGL